MRAPYDSWLHSRMHTPVNELPFKFWAVTINIVGTEVVSIEQPQMACADTLPNLVALVAALATNN